MRRADRLRPLIAALLAASAGASLAQSAAGNAGGATQFGPAPVSNSLPDLGSSANAVLSP